MRKQSIFLNISDYWIHLNKKLEMLKKRKGMISETYFKTKSSNQVEPCSWETIGTAIRCYYTFDWIKLRCNVINNNWYFKQKFYKTSFLRNLTNDLSSDFISNHHLDIRGFNRNELLNCSVDLYYFLLKKSGKMGRNFAIIPKNQSGNYFYPMFYMNFFNNKRAHIANF